MFAKTFFTQSTKTHKKKTERLLKTGEIAMLDKKQHKKNTKLEYFVVFQHHDA